jgi:3-hydroxyisobutyrate dehydrogenase-like beta-hydroxyacid dehydrogenase
MAQRVIDDGYHTTLWARRAESLDSYRDTAAHIAPDLRSLGEASDVLCVCVTADADVEEVLGGEAGALTGMADGGIVVVHSTVHPDTCRRLASNHPALAFLDAPVSGGGHMAAQRSLMVMVGGDPAVLERCRPVLDAFANPLIHLGPLGAGQVTKLLNNALFTATIGLAASLFEVAADRGVDLTALSEILSGSSGRSYAAEVLGSANHDLALFGELAGELLAKDVTILSELLAPQRPQVVQAAAAALDGMGFGLSERADG